MSEQIWINGYPVEIVRDVAEWDSTANAYVHNYESNSKRFAGMWQVGGAMHSGFKSIGVAKRSLMLQTKERVGWAQNQRFAICELVFKNRPEKKDETQVVILASK